MNKVNMRLYYDFLIVGSGLAGLSFALKVAPFGKVAIITKSKLEETNTVYAQGGIAAVTYQPDSYNKHIEDTLIAGDGLCNKKIVEMVISEAPARIRELIDWGANFDKMPNGVFDLAKEGGHSEKRILHHKDKTGFEIQRALIEQIRKTPSIEIHEHFFALDIITQHHQGFYVIQDRNEIECYGVYALDCNSNKILTILSKTVFLATGGNGNVYTTTTNPPIATGDGIAMVSRAKGIIENLEFIQFHPTSLYNPDERPSFLITEAIRGFGAVLVNPDGKEFMQKYDSRGSLAPRDIVARAIDNEMKIQGIDFVYLDCRQLDANELINHFPNIYSKCMELGIDITKDLIPVVPAVHYTCGGVKVNTNAQTSIKHLYAAGEVTSTGLHGANRLASNSLLEAIVYAHRAAVHAISVINNIEIEKNIPDWDDEGTSSPEEMVLITQELKELQQIMTNYVGIVRSDIRLKRALDRLEIIYRETESLYEKSTVSVKLFELRNSIKVAYHIIKMAKKRKESRGLHFNVDYPNKFKIFEPGK
jgi:L-aspartate oxidase